MIYKDDVEEIIFRIRGEINELNEKRDKYDEKIAHEIALKKDDLEVLVELAGTLPEKQPKLFEDNEIRRIISQE